MGHDSDSTADTDNHVALTLAREYIASALHGRPPLLAAH